MARTQLWSLAEAREGRALVVPALPAVCGLYLAPGALRSRRLDEHAGFNLDTPMGQQAFEGMGNGWPGVLSRIDGVLVDAARA